jgi:hypothetical protein
MLGSNIALVSKHKKGKQEEGRTARKIKEDWKDWKGLKPFTASWRNENRDSQTSLTSRVLTNYLIKLEKAYIKARKDLLGKRIQFFNSINY